MQISHNFTMIIPGHFAMLRCSRISCVRQNLTPCYVDYRAMTVEHYVRRWESKSYICNWTILKKNEAII